MGGKPPNTADKFWARAGDRDPRTGCRNWLGHKNPKGYGEVSWKGKQLRAHRIAWMLSTNRPIPPGMVVMHACDNPSCVEPTHLMMGTTRSNNYDMLRKGRHVSGYGVYQRKRKAQQSKPPEILFRSCAEASGGSPQDSPQVPENARVEEWRGGDLNPRPLGYEPKGQNSQVVDSVAPLPAISATMSENSVPKLCRSGGIEWNR
jgi:hypothetical protein